MRNKNLRLFLFTVLTYLILFHVLLFWSAKDKALTGSADFSAFYAAGRLVRAGLGSELYNPRIQARIQADLFPRVETRSDALLYYHPPFEALLFLPLSYMSYPSAYVLWSLINVSLLLLVPYLLRKDLSELEDIWHPLPTFFFLSFFPAFIAVLQGQDSILLLLLFTLAFVSLKRGHEPRAGCFLALGLFKFQFALPLLLLFLLRRRWKVILAFSAVATLLLLFCLPVTGVGGTLRYANFLWDLNRSLASHAAQEARAIYPETMPNLRGALYALSKGRFPERYTKLAVLLLSVALLIWSSLKCFPSGINPDRTSDLSFSLAVVVALLVSYHLQLHDLSLLSLPAAMLLKHTVSGGVRSAPVRLAVPALLTTFFLSPLYLVLMKEGRLYLLFWPILLFAVVVAIELFR